jgi:hypothetical protein
LPCVLPVRRRHLGDGSCAALEGDLVFWVARKQTGGRADTAFQKNISTTHCESAATFLHEVLEFLADFFACGLLFLELLLQSIHVINPRTNARERDRIARTR